MVTAHASIGVAFGHPGSDAAEVLREAAGLVRSIVRIGQTLHLETIAEGVETEEQLDRLTRLGAKLGQGYLFSRPLAAAELTKRMWPAGSLDAA